MRHWPEGYFFTVVFYGLRKLQTYYNRPQFSHAHGNPQLNRSKVHFRMLNS